MPRLSSPLSWIILLLLKIIFASFNGSAVHYSNAKAIFYFFLTTLMFSSLLKRGFTEFSEFTIIRRDRPNCERGGSVVICLHKSIPFYVVDVYFSPRNLNCVAAIIQSLQSNLFLVSIYRLPSAQFSSLHFDKPL